MKYVLLVFFVTGSPPVTPEHHFATSAEFDDRVTCEAVLEGLRNSRRYRVDGICAPKGKEGLAPEARKRLEEKFPPLGSKP